MKSCKHENLSGPTPAMFEDDDIRWVCRQCLRRFSPYMRFTFSCGHDTIAHAFSSLNDFPECHADCKNVTIVRKEKVAIV